MATNIEKLIELVKQRPEIYDCTLNTPDKKSKIDKIWNEIAYEMQRDAFECRSKWVNLRIAYAKHLRIIDQPGKITKEYYLAKQMDFLRKFMKRYGKQDVGLKQKQKPQNVSASFIKDDQSSCSSICVFEPEIQICEIVDSEDEREFGELFSGLSCIRNDENKESAKKPSNNLKKCRVDISYADQNFREIFEQLEKERRSKNNQNTSTVKKRKTKENENRTLESLQREDIRQMYAFNGDFQNILETHKEKTHENILPPVSMQKATLPYNSTLIPKKRLKTTHEDSSLTFFKGILPDVNQLSERGLRLFKQEILLILNQALDDQQSEYQKCHLKKII